MKKNRFFSKIRRSETLNAARPSILRLENLEERQLLSVTDLAPIVINDSTTHDSLLVANTYVDDSAIDLSSVLNTMADDPESQITSEEDKASLEQLRSWGVTFYVTGIRVEQPIPGGPQYTYVSALEITEVPSDRLDFTIPSFSYLTQLNVAENQLTGLDVSQLPILETLRCENNELGTIDVSNNSSLKTLVCYNNNIKTLNLPKSESARLSRFSQLEIDYDVDELFIERNTHASVQSVKITLYNIPALAFEQVKNVVSVVPTSGNTSHYEISPHSLANDLYSADFSLPRLNSQAIHDPIYANVTVDREVHTMVINPMIKLRELVKSEVTAVVENDATLGTVDLVYRDKAGNYDDPYRFSFSIPGENDAAINVSACFAVNNITSYPDIDNIAVGLFNKSGELTFVDCNENLVPRDEPYEVTITATCDGASESHKFKLKINKAKLATPSIKGEATVNTATLTWEPVAYASEYIVKLNDVEIGTVNANETTTEYQFTAENLKPGTKYTFTVTAVREHMEDSDPATVIVTTLAPEIAVTIADDVVNPDDDFNQDGTLGNISLREAYNYVNRYYVVDETTGSGSWELAADADVFYDAENDLYIYGNDHVVYKTIKFADSLTEVSVNAPIVVDKSFVVDGNSIAINGQSRTRIFEINAGTITANGVVLKKGWSSDEPVEQSADAYVDQYPGYGGAIYIASGGAYVANGGSFTNNFAAKYGGAVYVAKGGSLTVDGATFTDNTSTRGGAIANYGTGVPVGNESRPAIVISGATSFTDNLAIPSASTKTNGSFGGAIYNAGTISIDGSNLSDSKITFSGNKATNGTNGESVITAKIYGADSTNPIGEYLKGYSGGAIYNTTQKIDSQTFLGTITATNVNFENNFAGKYGGAVSNFGTFLVEESSFSGNIASSGGAIQNAGQTVVNAGAFEANVALTSVYTLDAAGLDFGGNGGAIFSSLSDGFGGILTITGETSFSANQAANAGGAIDYLSGSMTFDAAAVSVESNVAQTFGGGIVIASQVGINESEFTIEGNKIKVVVIESDSCNEAFHKDPTKGKVGFYAPNVAITCDVGDEAIAAISTAFFDKTEPGQDKVALFVRYMTKTEANDKLTFDDLASGIPGNPNKLFVQINGGSEKLWTAESVEELGEGVHEVRYYVPVDEGEEKIYYRANISVVGGDSAIISQIDLSDLNLSGSGVPVGVSIRVHTANPVKTWTVNWDADNSETTPIPYDVYGYAFNMYNFYESEGQYHVILVTTDDENNVQTYDLGNLVARTPTSNATNSTQDDVDSGSGATLDLDVFSNLDFVDELFEI